jgi:hypothetical protein
VQKRYVALKANLPQKADVHPSPPRDKTLILATPQEGPADAQKTAVILNITSS